MGGGPEAAVFVIVGTLLVSIGIPVLGAAAYFFTRGVKTGRRKVIIAASLFPLACFGWVALVSVIQGAVNEDFRYRDAGFGDMWACPLPDGYAVMMIDDPDVGVLYNLKTQTIRSGVSWNTGIDSWGTGIEDAIGGVRVLQLAGPYILGGLDSHLYDHSESDKKQVDSYFLLDTRTGRHTGFSTYGALNGNAEQLGFTLKLEPIFVVYSKYRFTWFEGFAAIILFVPPFLAAWMLGRWIIRLRRIRSMVQQPT